MDHPEIVKTLIVVSHGWNAGKRRPATHLTWRGRPVVECPNQFPDSTHAAPESSSLRRRVLARARSGRGVSNQAQRRCPRPIGVTLPVVLPGVDRGGRTILTGR